jgi:predicted DNA-binding transcriptional regulator YafY
MRADRLLTTLLLLQAHGKLSSRTLAERLEVSARTVHRDMEALGAAGVPVLALRGAQGGWQLDEGWRTRVPGLDEAELRALLMAQPRAIGSPRLQASAERALAKLIAALPVPLRAQAESLRQRLHVDPTGWSGTTEDVSALPVVQEAIAADRVLAIDYRPPGRELATRNVQPLGLVAKGTTWYLVANSARGLRTYRVSRIEHAVMTTERFARPPGFDLAKYWASSTEAFRNQQPYAVVIRIDADLVPQVWMLRGQRAGGTPDAEGRVTVPVEFSCEDEACFMILGLGAGVDVIEPDALRARVEAEIAAMAARLGSRAAVSATQTPRARRSTGRSAG